MKYLLIICIVIILLNSCSMIYQQFPEDRNKKDFRVENHIVLLKVEIDADKFNPTNTQSTGFFINSKKLICTSAHAFGDSKELNIQAFYKGKRIPVQVIATDNEKDIAILKVIDDIEYGNDFFRTQGDQEVFENVIIAGFPVNRFLMDDNPTFNSGIISAKDRYININGKKSGPFLQTDAYALEGFSGSPVIDKNGNLMGMVNYVYSKDDVWMGFTFITPASSLFEFIKTVKD